jgi:hypothetical protein
MKIGRKRVLRQQPYQNKFVLTSASDYNNFAVAFIFHF